MTGQAIPHCRWMHCSLDVLRSFVFVAGETQRRSRRRRQLYSSHVFAHSHFMAGQASALHGGVHELVLRLIRVALKTLFCVDILIQWHRVHSRINGSPGQYKSQRKDPGGNPDPAREAI